MDIGLTWILMGTVVDCFIEVGWMDAETNVVVNIESGG
jgi:hypothetical protein